MLEPERIKKLNDEVEKSGEFVLYWMQASQRAEENQALQMAVNRANELNLPVITYFGITDDFPEGNLRHYQFMIEGLKETKERLAGRGIKTMIGHQSPPEGIIELAEEAALVVVDRGYLRIQRNWRKTVAEEISVPLIQVEGDVVVPVEAASDKEEYAARTIRPKINDRLDDFSAPAENFDPDKSSLDMDLQFDSVDLDEILEELNIDRSVKPVRTYTSGTTRAKELLEDFIKDKLDQYAEKSNDPTVDVLSEMSPYLHFGQISPIFIADRINDSGSPGAEDYLEQLVVRRELSMNFVYYNEDYDDFSSILPDWALETLSDHADDPRDYVYTREEFERAETHDPYWNAAQKEMNLTGKTHGYMRMYWGKKILEWTPDPETGFEITLYLNNKYELDGRDPNGFTGVAWCYGKHDRGWKEREVFGKVRYMNASGLERKFDAEKYCEQVDRLEKKLTE
ncbi:MAG: deoxyribodipyrimidine photo-lyase [Candidatus Bipolaricaulota bacterium]|nr:deoxyribodipyrimidine photo-lyase [Candidatus Bipolaricaulota bacterium]MBS3791433.1 deoxyribodipyrimidine photo-lyase [Candidatus Bipolaricaulota bacterium]